MAVLQDKIKVLFRHRSMEMGGVEKVLLSMLNHLDKQKFELSVGINLHQGELRNAIPSDIKTTFLAKGKEDFSKNKILYYTQLALRKCQLNLYKICPWILHQWIMKNNADVEIATGYTMFDDVLRSANKKSKKIGWFHSDITFPKLQPIVPKLLQQIPKFDYFIFGSQQAHDIFVSTYPDVKLPPNQVVLNAIPIEEIRVKAAQETIQREAVPTFVGVGRLHSRKGFHTLLEAHAQLLNEGFAHQIWIIGDGEEYEALRQQIQALGVEKSFLLLGTKMNPYPYIQAADAFIMPSESEGWPLIIAETLILKKPIIATRVGGIPEMIQDRETGLLCEYSIADLAKTMKIFFEDKDAIHHIEKNLQDIDKKFDNQKIFNTVEDIIIKTVKK